MKSKVNPSFWYYFRRLPIEVRKVALKNYRLWIENYFHPSLHFKVVFSDVECEHYSVRVGLSWRALGVYDPNIDIIEWYWIGSHAEYDKILG